MGACPSASCRTDCSPGPFPKFTYKSLTISNTSRLVCSLGFGWWSGLPLKCLPFFLKVCCFERNRRCPGYIFFLQLSKYTLSFSSKQCVHAMYPLFVYPKMLLRANHWWWQTATLVGQIPLVSAHPTHVHQVCSTTIKVHQLMALGTHQCCFRVALGLGWELAS
jgi:hypothetical protein